MQSTINQRVKEVRNDLRIDQVTFGEALDYKQATISMIERGDAAVVPNLIEALNKEFRVSKLYLEKGKGGMYDEEPSVRGKELSELIKSKKQNTPIDMIIKYENLKADYDRLKENYERLEKLLDLYQQQSPGQVKGKSRQA